MSADYTELEARLRKQAAEIQPELLSIYEEFAICLDAANALADLRKQRDEAVLLDDTAPGPDVDTVEKEVGALLARLRPAPSDINQAFYGDGAKDPPGWWTDRPAPSKSTTCPRCSGTRIDPEHVGSNPREPSACMACCAPAAPTSPSPPEGADALLRKIKDEMDHYPWSRRDTGIAIEISDYFAATPADTVAVPRDKLSWWRTLVATYYPRDAAEIDRLLQGGSNG